MTSGVGNRENGFGNLPGNVTLNRPVANSNPLGTTQHKATTLSQTTSSTALSQPTSCSPPAQGQHLEQRHLGNTIESKYDNPLLVLDQRKRSASRKINTESMRTNNVQTSTYTNRLA